MKNKKIEKIQKIEKSKKSKKKIKKLKLKKNVFLFYFLLFFTNYSKIMLCWFLTENVARQQKPRKYFLLFFVFRCFATLLSQKLFFD